MIKIFVTGDNHIGINYNSFPNLKQELIESRFEALERMVKKADEDDCDMFVVTGDLFDRVTGITKESAKRVADILSEFGRDVVIIPGNHDYYTEGVDIWKKFDSVKDSNTILLNKYEKYPMDIGDQKVVFYPAFCDSKHSDTNRLDWIKTAEIDKDVYNIGLAHGAVEGISPDTTQKYFFMRRAELESIPVDAWFIGHTHLQYPDNLCEDKDIEGYKIFNAGTHEQEDLGDNTEGAGFIITLDKQPSGTKVLARKFVSGRFRFVREVIEMAPGSHISLSEEFQKMKDKYDSYCIVDVVIKGTCKPEDYSSINELSEDLESVVKDLKVNTDDLCEEITYSKIRSEFAETSFAAKFLEELIDEDDPITLQIAYGLVKDCQE